VVWPLEPCAEEMPEPLENPELDDDPEEPEPDEEPEELDEPDEVLPPEAAALPVLPLDVVPLAELACEEPGSA
jgi:hypothetical protein